MIQNQGQEDIPMVYFPMRGEIMVGYNHKRYVTSLDINEMDISGMSARAETQQIFKISLAQRLMD